MSRVDVLGSVPIFEQEICEDIMGGRSLPWGACRCRVLIREVGFSKGDGDAEAEQTCLRGDTEVKVLRAGTYSSSPLGEILGWHDGRGDSTNDVAAEDGKEAHNGGGAHRDSTALWLTG